MSEPVVNFSELSNDKKQEFLNFLLNNNIKFQEGSDNYIAKVTLKDSKLAQKENKIPYSPAKRSTGKSAVTHTPVNNKKTQKLLQQLSHNNQVEKQQVDSKQASSPAKVKKGEIVRGHIRHSIVAPQQTPISQRSSLPPLSPGHSQTRNRSKSANTKQTSSSLVGEQHVKINRQSSRKSSLKITRNTSPRAMRTQKNLYDSTDIVPAAQLQTSHTALFSKPPQKQSSNYPADKLNELLSTLKVPSVPCRPTRLPRIQVLKTIEEVYNGNFTKNTILLKNRKFKEACERGNYVFSAYVIEHFEEKYKTAKLYQGQMLNLAHSLLCYTHEAHPSSSLTMFYKFLVQDFEYQDLVFFLFIRSIFEREFGETMEKLTTQNPTRIYQQHIISRKQISRFIKAILGKDSQEIVSEFQQMIFSQMDECIPLYDLFTILLVDYQCKRKSKTRIGLNNLHLSNVNTKTFVSPAIQNNPINRNNQINRNLQPEEESYRKCKPKQLFIEAPSNFHKMSKCSMFHDGSQSNIDQLTFGDCSVSNRVEEEDETEFWNDFESLKMAEGDALFEQLEQKLRKKVSELVEIMLGDEESLWNGPARQLGKLILHKSLSMLDAIISMDKIKWFRLLKIQKPTQHHLEVVEALQLMLRNIRRLSKLDQNQECLEVRHLQSEFCKALLTVEQLKKAIEKIVIE